jgi:osmoprotectant transport system permease protein
MNVLADFAAGWEFIRERSGELALRTSEHLALTGMSLGLAMAIGIPLGMLACVFPKTRGPLLSIVGIFQTIPSLALLAILLTLVGMIGVVPAVIALTIYGLLPIVRNTVTGIEGVPAETVEAARGVGMTPMQTLWLVQFRLAMPVIVAGIRTAAVVGVGVATLSAFIGAGGLGQFINRGLAMTDNRLILLGAIPAALLAIAVDTSIALLVWGMQPVRHGEQGRFRRPLRNAAIALPVLCLLGVAAGALAQPRQPHDENTIVIGSKSFTEQLILAEMLSQLIEDRTDLSVKRMFNLGGTMICHRALVAGEIDLYIEYTGTGLMTVLGRERMSDAEAVSQVLRNEYASRWGIAWLPELGFNNSFALVVRADHAKANSWKCISDLKRQAPRLKAGFVSEFVERDDGYRGLTQAYDLRFGSVFDLDAALMYSAVAQADVDVISGFRTDGRIDAWNLLILEDDRTFFPPCRAAPIVRDSVLRDHPELREVLAQLHGVIDDATMRQLNSQVDQHKRSPQEVAREFLRSRKLVK